MNFYSEDKINQAFSVFSNLLVSGSSDEQETRSYVVDDEIRNLIHMFADRVASTVFISSGRLILIPLAVASPFHVSNDTLKNMHLPAKSKNIDIYMMYLCIIILFGEFYDSYQASHPTRDFITKSEWLDTVNVRIDQITSIGEEALEKIDESSEYNWSSICREWNAKNDVVDGKKADARSISRLAFIKVVLDFLEDQKLIGMLNGDEIGLTERARGIVEYYYMNSAYNRGIIEILYGQEA